MARGAAIVPGAALVAARAARFTLAPKTSPDWLMTVPCDAACVETRGVFVESLDNGGRASESVCWGRGREQDTVTERFHQACVLVEGVAGDLVEGGGGVCCCLVSVD
jgi:hypothetical protein